MDEGIAGVVAMRCNVYVVTAAQFVTDRYAELVRGWPLGQAATLVSSGGNGPNSTRSSTRSNTRSAASLAIPCR